MDVSTLEGLKEAVKGWACKDKHGAEQVELQLCLNQVLEVYYGDQETQVIVC